MDIKFYGVLFSISVTFPTAVTKHLIKIGGERVYFGSWFESMWRRRRGRKCLTAEREAAGHTAHAQSGCTERKAGGVQVLSSFYSVWDPNPWDTAATFKWISVISLGVTGNNTRSIPRGVLSR